MPTRFAAQARSYRQYLIPSKATPSPTTNSILAATAPQKRASVHQGLSRVATKVPCTFGAVLLSKAPSLWEHGARVESNTITEVDERTHGVSG